MITKLNYDNKGRFDLSGTIKVTCVDFENSSIDTKKFFPLTVNIMLGLKKNILKQLADDNKILGEERVEAIKEIDKFLTLVFAFALITSKMPYMYQGEIPNHFDITVQVNKTKYLTGKGRLYNISSRDIADYIGWVDEKIIRVFKNVILEFNANGDPRKMKSEVTRLIFNTFCFRYKIEYI